MQQANGGGGNGNRQSPDLSTLFDQELRKQQQTNYEQQSTTADAAQQKQEGRAGSARRDPRAGAPAGRACRSSSAISRKNKDQMSAEEVKRQLERLTREQEELRRQAEELAKKMQAATANRPTGQQANRPTGQPGQQGERAREARARPVQGLRARSCARSPKRCATPPAICAARIRSRPARAARRPAKRLRGIEQRMQGARPEERTRAMGDLQLEARQIADAERRLGNEASRTAPGSAGEDARRRLAAEQERLADRTAASWRIGEAAGRWRRRARREAGDDRGRPRARSTEPGRPHARIGAGDAPGAAGRINSRPAPPTRSRARWTRSPINWVPPASAMRRHRACPISCRARRSCAIVSAACSGRWRSSRNRVRRVHKVQQGAQGAQGAQPGAEGKEGSTGQQGSSAGGRDGKLSQLQREADSQMREAQKLAEEMQRENPGMQKGGSTPEQWQRSVSAPGTEAIQAGFREVGIAQEEPAGRARADRVAAVRSAARARESRAAERRPA